MPTVRYRDDDSSSGTTIATVLLGAAAGFAVGMYVAQRLGGFSGLVRRFRRAGAASDASENAAFYEAAGEDFLDDESQSQSLSQDETDTETETETDFDWDDDEGDGYDVEGPESPEPIIEERVLEAFNNDPVLSERAIDIGAVGSGVIELEGWVDDDREAEHAVTIARGVPGVRSVANRLMVDDGTT